MTTQPRTLTQAEQALRQRLDGADVRVGALGVRDELAADAWGAGYPVQVYGSVALVGPLATGRGCAQCLARRWQTRRPGIVRDALEHGGATGTTGEPPQLTGFALDTIATLLRAGRPAGGFPVVYRVDLETLLVTSFPLVPDEACPRCGADDEPAGFGWRPTPKQAPGSFRARSLAEYDLPVAALANPVCGVLGAGVISQLDSPTTAAAMGAFTMRTDAALHEVFWGGHAGSYADSIRIGLLEGLERQAGMRPHGGVDITRASLRELRAAGRAAVDPRDCGLYPDEYHAARPWLAPFTEDREIAWVAGHSLRDDAPVLVPEVLTYYYSTPAPDRFVQECSSGCASGGSLLEATYFGLLELIERDAFLLAWYGRVPLPEIDPGTSGDPAGRFLVDRLDMYGFDTRVFDATTTPGVPVVVAAAIRRDDRPGALCFGAGASLDPESALRSALVEIATDAPPLRRRTEANLAELTAMAADFDLVGTVHDHPLLYGLPQMRRHADFLLDRVVPRRAMADVFADVPAPALDLAVDLKRCVRLLVDHDVIVVDQTGPRQREMGVHTACVLVPGLLPIDFGWARQRALRMPRLRDRCPEPNPAPHPFP